MAERSSDLIILISKEFLSIYLSPSAHSVIGYDPEEFVGKPAEYWDQTHLLTERTGFLPGCSKNDEW